MANCSRRRTRCGRAVIPAACGHRAQQESLILGQFSPEAALERPRDQCRRTLGPRQGFSGRNGTPGMAGGLYSAPNAPSSPDPPRSFPGRGGSAAVGPGAALVPNGLRDPGRSPAALVAVCGGHRDEASDLPRRDRQRSLPVPAAGGLHTDALRIRPLGQIHTSSLLSRTYVRQLTRALTRAVSNPHQTGFTRGMKPYG